MKSVTMQVKKDQLNRLISELSPGDLIVITDGNRRFIVEPCDTQNLESGSLDLEEDSSELGEELLKGLKGPFTDYSRGDLDAVAAKVIKEKQQE